MDKRVGPLWDIARAGRTPSPATPSAAAATSHLASMYPSGSGGGGAEHALFEPQQQQAAPPLDPPPPAAKKRRSGADGCQLCRARKIKCSGRPGDNTNGPCHHCAKFKYDCSFVDGELGRASRVTPSRERTEAGTARRRAQKACRQCHLHKTKCSGDVPRCTRCAANNLVCEYVATRRRFSHAPASLSGAPSDSHEAQAGPSSALVKDDTNTLPSPLGFVISPALTSSTRRSSAGNLYGEELLARKDTLVRHFQVFFSLWAHMPCMGIMHPETTYAEIDERELHPIVAAAVCAMTSRIIAPGQRQIPFAEECADQVDFYLFRTMDTFLRHTGPKNLIVLVCAMCHFWHENQMSKVWMYMGLSARLITALQLNWDGAGESLIQHEMNRRLVWACYILDRLLAGGFDEHLVLRDNDMHLKLPVSNEVLYEAVGASGTRGKDVIPCGPLEKTSGRKKLSLDGHHLRLHRLRHQILGFTKRLTSPPFSHPRRQLMEASQVIKLVNTLQNHLVNFKSSLSEELSLTDANINRFLSSSEGPSFIMLHSLFWILHVDLYHFTVPGIREAANPELIEKLPGDFVYKSQRQVVGYAVSLARFWRNLQGIVATRPPGNGTEKLLTVDQMFAIYVIQPTKILLAARQHRLFDNLEESTAPMVRQEPVDDAALAALVQSNMQLIPPFARFFPRILDITKDLRHAVDNFSHNTTNDQVGTIGTPAMWQPDDFRLPAPQYLLENAMSPQEADKHDRDREKQRNMSAADRWFQYKKRPKEENPVLMTPPVTRPPDETAAVPFPASSAPEIPIWLAEARGCDTLPETPPQDSSGSADAAQAWLSTQSGVGLGLSDDAYLCDDDIWSMPPPQTDYNMTYGLSGPPALLYERARGSASAAIIPTMHAGNGGAAGSRRNYEGATGTKEPSFCSQ